MTTPTTPLAMPEDSPTSWFHVLWRRCQGCLHDNIDVLFANLSRATNLLAVLNVSLFFLSGAVTRGGYTWPLCSLGLLGLLQLLLVLPLGLNRRLGFYLFLVALWGTATFLFGGSLVYWLIHNR